MRRIFLGVKIRLLICTCPQICNKECTWWHLMELGVKVKTESMKDNEILYSRLTPMKDTQRSHSLNMKKRKKEEALYSFMWISSTQQSFACWLYKQFRSSLCFCVYLGVREDFMRCDKELEDGVLLSWCSGVVRGPSMLTPANKNTMKRQPVNNCTRTHTKKTLRGGKKAHKVYPCSSPGWRSSLCSRWSGAPSSAARFPPSQTGPSNRLEEPTDARQPEQKRRLLEV